MAKSSPSFCPANLICELLLEPPPCPVSLMGTLFVPTTSRMKVGVLVPIPTAPVGGKTFCADTGTAAPIRKDTTATSTPPHLDCFIFVLRHDCFIFVLHHHH